MQWAGVWLVVLLGAFLLDQPITGWLHSHGFHNDNPRLGSVLIKGTRWAYALKTIGSIYVTAAVAAVLLVAGLLPWRKAATLLLCATTSIITDPLKWTFGRARPVDEAGRLTDAMDFLLFTTRDPANSFPSGNTMIAFATAACLVRYYPRWWPLFYGLATVVAVERVVEVAHHLSDVVAAAGIGIILSHSCMWALARWAPRLQPRPRLVQQPQLEAVEEGST